MYEIESITAEFNDCFETSTSYKADAHMNEPAILKYADALMSGELYSINEIKHVKECGFCKNKVLSYLSYYGFNELKVR